MQRYPLDVTSPGPYQLMGTADRENGREHAVQKHWFGKLPATRQNEILAPHLPAIIKPHFEAAHPDTPSVKRAVRDYENDVTAEGWESVSDIRLRHGLARPPLPE